MRILVTGGAGYIGSHLVDLLLSKGHEVTVLDNLSTGKIENVNHCLRDIRFINGSILDASLVELEVERCEMVFHLAAAVGVRHIVDRPLESLLVNAQGAENVLSSCFKFWRKVVVASTSEVYGKTAKVPMSEDDDRVLGSTTVHRWGYSTAKALDEHLAFGYASHGLPMSIVRYFNSYGERIDPRGYGSVVASFITAATKGRPITVHGDGSQTRCFTYIEDTVLGTYLAGFVPEAEGQVFNIGNPTETSIMDLALRIKEITGSASEITSLSYEDHYGPGFEDTARRVPDMSRAADILDWSPRVDLQEGLGRTLDWWKQAEL